MNTKNLTLGATKLAEKLALMQAEVPYFHAVLGSGFKDSLHEGVPPSFKVKGEIYFSDLPGLHASTAPGHAGKYVVVEHLSSKKVGILQVGRLHGFEGLDPREVVRTVLYTRELGTSLYFITNAAGGMDPAHSPGDVMMIVDQINLTGKSPLVGQNPKKPDGTEWGPRFLDLTKLFDMEWKKTLASAFKDQKLKVHEGVYMGVLGPAFETPAEIRFFSQVGAHTVGMSTVWETIALKHTGATVCALSLISNIAAGLSTNSAGELEELDHFAILDACKSSSTSILRGILLSVEKSLGGLPK